MAQSYKAKNPIQSVKTSFKIIRQLQIREGASGAELAESLDMSKGSIHNHLQTLYEVGYVTRENDVYHLGLRFLEHGIYARQRYSIYEVAKPEVDRLAEKTGELANLLVEEHGLGTYLYRAKGENSVNVDARIGTHVHLHNTALGKSILAHRPQSEVESILDRHGVPATTERTITDRGELFDQLETIREQGVAFDDEERLPGLQCVAVPILDQDDLTIGALSIAIPTRRMDNEPLESDIPTVLKDAANVIKLNISYS
jgi:DNA-binding IclR family transcriptional regulator